MGTMTCPNRVIRKKKTIGSKLGVTVDGNEASTKQRKSQEREFSEHEANVSGLFL